MKKIFTFAGILFATGILLTGCGGVKPDEFGWYHDLAAAKKEAQTKNKNILLLMTADDSDTESSKMKTAVFNTDEFTAAEKDAFVFCNLDFSQSEYAKGQAADGASEKEKKVAENAAARFNDNLKLATTYSITKTPCVLVLTKEGYMIAPIENDEETQTPSAYQALLDAESEKIGKVTDMVKATTVGGNVEKVRAIDTLYEATDTDYRYPLADLIRSVPALDEKNETGLVGKYVLATANADAMDAYMNKDVKGATDAFAKAAGSDKLSAEQKQQAYYTAGYILGSSGSQDYDTMLSYFQSAYDAAPESGYAVNIAQMITMIKAAQAQQSAGATAVPGGTEKPSEKEE
ncbi:MAG: thioredoxin family protein [Treponema sp.]|nr:thioredoxin family protein [Treponema sp.]